MGSEIVLSVNPSGHADTEMLLLMISPVDDEDDLQTFDGLLQAARLPANHDRFLHPQRRRRAVVERSYRPFRHVHHLRKEWFDRDRSQAGRSVRRSARE